MSGFFMYEKVPLKGYITLKYKYIVRIIYHHNKL
jgi:hypothetical protein